MSREHSSDERGPEHHLHLKQQGKMPTSDPAMLSRPISEDVVEVRFLDGMDSGLGTLVVTLPISRRCKRGKTTPGSLRKSTSS
ncbi:hypothetical protein KCU79_g42, partial [Aureobasidium melanogenum]